MNTNYRRQVEAVLNKDYAHELPDKPRSKDYNRVIRNMLVNMFPEAKIIPTKGTWCQASGFISFPDGNYLYYIFPDYRYDKWDERILIRTAKDEHDYTGGANHYADLDKLRDEAEWLHRCMAHSA